MADSDHAGIDVGVLRVNTTTSSVPGSDCEVTTLYILPDACGRGPGCGALILPMHERQHSGKGHESLGLCVLAGNERGQRFYERCGAYRIGERVAFQWEGHSIMEFLYRFAA